MDKQQLLYHYFLNALTPEQEELFNDLLATDTEFKHQFDFEKDLQSAIRDKQAKDLKSKLAGFEKDIAREIPVRQLPKTNYRKWALAASIVLLIGLSWWGFYGLGTDYQGLYNENFEVYPNTVFTITRGDSANSLEREAFAAYETQDYRKTIGLFEMLKARSDEAYLDFYLGQSYLKLGEPAKALPYLQAAASSGSGFEAEAHWYLALGHLKLGDSKSATAELSRLIGDFEYNGEKAQKLLEDIE